MRPKPEPLQHREPLQNYRLRGGAKNKVRPLGIRPKSLRYDSKSKPVEPALPAPRPLHECNTYVEDLQFRSNADFHHSPLRRFYCIHGIDRIIGPIAAPLPEKHGGANGQRGMVKGRYLPKPSGATKGA